MTEFPQQDHKAKFKFFSLKTYASTEWLAHNQEKYRQVFDAAETTYIYAELGLINKQIEQENWVANVELKCFHVEADKLREVCKIQVRKKVGKHQHMVYVREGWGHKEPGRFWKRGTYFWEAWVDGVKAGVKYFYIEHAESANADVNPYFEVTSVKLYEGDYEDVHLDERDYYHVFSADETRYIYAEIKLKNLNIQRDWQCELIVKFINEVHELKGQVIRMNTIHKGEEEISLSIGWGSNTKGSWRPGSYSMDLIFLDRIVATAYFEVDEFFEEGLCEVSYEYGPAPGAIPAHLQPLTFEDVLQELENVARLDGIKRQVREHAKYIKFLQHRKKSGFKEEEEINIHSVFSGNPGTGKTTVAAMMGMLYHKMGLLSKGHVHTVDRVDLVGEYIGQTAPKVKKVIDQARGGVLFIDEAYALARTNDDSKDFGREVIEILVKEMSNGPGDLAIIVAGYPKEMKHFMDSNPGLKSRFKLFYDFKDYLPQELYQIADIACSKKEVRLTPGARKELEYMILKAFRSRDRTFGNARFVFDLIEKCKVQMGLRVMGGTPLTTNKHELSTIKLEDVKLVQKGLKYHLPIIPVDEQLLQMALDELESLIGMREIKQEIYDFVSLIKYHLAVGDDVLSKFSLHTVFVGNPGTGKTTVARILTKIYKALGILERGHMVETDRQGLVAGFLGQTAIKTAEKIDEAKGGVLFIDEAYALTQHTAGTGDYGSEAINTIVKRMEDMRGEFFLFVAGYPENMDKFLKSNPGLSSRFDRVLKFKDYNAEDLMKIASEMIFSEGYQLDSKATIMLKEITLELYRKRDKYFGNARVVRAVIEKIIKHHNIRIAKLLEAGREIGQKKRITSADIKAYKEINYDSLFERSRIGFRP